MVRLWEIHTVECAQFLDQNVWGRVGDGALLASWYKSSVLSWLGWYESCVHWLGWYESRVLSWLGWYKSCPFMARLV